MFYALRTTIMYPARCVSEDSMVDFLVPYSCRVSIVLPAMCRKVSWAVFPVVPLRDCWLVGG